MTMRSLWVVLCLATIVVRAFSDHQSRINFVNEMDKAVGEKRRLQDLRKRLLAKAHPVPEGFRSLEDAAAGEDEANDDGQYNANDDGLDLSSYSLKYVGCQAVNTWSDNMAQDEDANTVFALERFVVLRLCPSMWCSQYRKFGCGRNYGEYMILMEDYLAIMKEYHYSRFSTYCQICDQCMGGQSVSYQAANDDDAANDDAAGDDAADDDAVGDDQYQGDDVAGDDQYQGDDAVQGDDQYQGDDANVYEDQYQADDAAAGEDQYQGYDGAQGDDNWNNVNNDNIDQSYCQYEDQCLNFHDLCQYYHYYSSSDYENFMACSEFQMGDSVVYLGPHCGSDRHSITIGVFEDQYCSSYLGDAGSYEEIQGYSDIDEDSLAFYYLSTCISCSNKKSDWILGDNDHSDDSTYELCEVMYDTSAKCNKYLATDNDYESENQEVTEATVCSFIGSLVEDNYDESGEIKPISRKYSWYNYHRYGMSLGQVVWLVISVTLFVGLSAYVCYLNRALVHRKAWTRPMLDPKSPEFIAGKLSRCNSEILMSRSPTSWEQGDDISTISGFTGDTPKS